MRKLDLCQLRLELQRHQLAFRTSIASKREQVLVVQMPLDLLQVRFDGNWRGGAQKIGLTAGLFGHLAQIVLAKRGQSKGSRSTALGRIVNAPKVYVFPLRALDRRI